MEIVQWEDLAGVASLAYQEDWFDSGDRSSFNVGKMTNKSMDQLSLDPRIGFREEVYVNKAMLTQEGKYILVQICKLVNQGRSTKRIVAFEISSLARLQNTKATSLLDCLDISNEVMTRIEAPLGILPGKTLVFLDKDLWMCTLGMNFTRQLIDLKRHYFIPRDWASTEGLEQCCMLHDGTFLCPRDGEVAVINSIEWWDLDYLTFWIRHCVCCTADICVHRHCDT